MASQSKSPPDDSSEASVSLSLGFNRTDGPVHKPIAAPDGTNNSTEGDFTEIVGLSDYAVSQDGSTISLSFESRKDGPLRLSIPAAYLDGLMSVLRDVRTTATQRHQPDKTVLSFRGLKSWAVAAYPGHDSVLLLLDGETPLETSYAMEPKTAKELATALAGTADKVMLSKPRSDH